MGRGTWDGGYDLAVRGGILEIWLGCFFWGGGERWGWDRWDIDEIEKKWGEVGRGAENLFLFLFCPRWFLYLV